MSMDWNIKFEIPESFPKINHQSVLFSIGSCFSGVIGEKLSERKFKVLTNPFGTIFNPISLAHLLEDSLLEMPINKELITAQDGLYLHFGMHSDVVAYSIDSLEKLIQKKQNATKTQLENATHLLITFGSAWVYELKERQQLVANCHKQPSSIFEKRLLNTEELLKTYINFFNLIHEINPKLKVILTVSPVRHLKDGVSENQISKSILRVACHELCESFDFVNYFPSFEIMMDELRDYRFYKEDLIHPTAQAEDYIWGKFKMAWIDPSTYPLIQEVEQIKRDLTHRAFNPESPTHLKFLENLQKKLEKLSKSFDFSKEIDLLRKQVQSRGK
jgi:hypothetical protein